MPVGFVLSLLAVARHLYNWNHPRIQRYYLRFTVAPAVLAVCAMGGLLFPRCQAMFVFLRTWYARIPVYILCMYHNAATLLPYAAQLPCFHGKFVARDTIRVLWPSLLLQDSVRRVCLVVVLLLQLSCDCVVCQAIASDPDHGPNGSQVVVPFTHNS